MILWIEIVLDALALDRLTVDVEKAALHLHLVAGQSDEPLDVVGRIVLGPFEDDDVAALGRMREDAAGDERQAEWQRIAAIPV
jgi:hypothetical protein